MSAVLLLGLLANAVLSWSWADPIAALVIAGVAVEEGHAHGAAPAAAILIVEGEDVNLVSTIRARR